MNGELFLDKKDVIKYIMQTIELLKDRTIILSDDDYHHNTSYQSILSIITYGIHSLSKQNELGVTIYTPSQLKILKDTNSHINGDDGISLSKVNLKDIRDDEFIYNPKDKNMVDIIIHGIVAYRNSMHYGNEFISQESIMPDKFKSLDIRLIKLINETKNINDLETLKKIVERFNYLKQIAILLDKKELDIPIREMSQENNTTLNKTKLLSLPIIKISQ